MLLVTRIIITSTRRLRLSVCVRYNATNIISGFSIETTAAAAVAAVLLADNRLTCSPLVAGEPPFKD